MGNGDGISKGTIPHEQRVSNRSIINVYVEGQSEMVVFFCGARRLKSIPTVLFVHSLGNDLIHRKP